MIGLAIDVGVSGGFSGDGHLSKCVRNKEREKRKKSLLLFAETMYYNLIKAS